MRAKVNDIALTLSEEEAESVCRSIDYLYNKLVQEKDSLAVKIMEPLIVLGTALKVKN